MRVLMVASGNDQLIYGVSSFTYEQTIALRKKGIEVEIFPIVGKGVLGYLKAAIKLNKLLMERQFDVIHGHYIMSALVTFLQFKAPVVTSFIGSDINITKYRILSKLTAYIRSDAIIFVSQELQKISGYKKYSHVVPYGLDLNKFYPISKHEARRILKWPENEVNILFASRFDRLEKNAQLAFNAIDKLKRDGIKCKLFEFKNIKKEDLNFYYNACDLFLLTSLDEGSPQSIKEAIACNCPIVATDVGDVKLTLGNTDGCYISSYDVDDVVAKIIEALSFSAKHGRTNGRKRIHELGLDDENIANRIIAIYQAVLKNKR